MLCLKHEKRTSGLWSEKKGIGGYGVVVKIEIATTVTNEWLWSTGKRKEHQTDTASLSAPAPRKRMASQENTAAGTSAGKSTFMPADGCRWCQENLQTLTLPFPAHFIHQIPFQLPTPVNNSLSRSHFLSRMEPKHSTTLSQSSTSKPPKFSKTPLFSYCWLTLLGLSPRVHENAKSICKNP